MSEERAGMDVYTKAVGHVEALIDRLESIRDTSLVLIAARSFVYEQRAAIKVAPDKLALAVEALRAVISDCNLAASACDNDGPRKGFLHIANDARQALAAIKADKEPVALVLNHATGELTTIKDRA